MFLFSVLFCSDPSKLSFVMLKFLSSLSAAVSGGFKFGLKWVLDFGPEIGPLVWLIND